VNGILTDVRVPRLSEEGIDYFEPDIDEAGNPILVQMFTEGQMDAFAKENITVFADLLLSIDTSTPMGRVAFDIIMGTSHLNIQMAMLD
jgi:hypothetical protein